MPLTKNDHAPDRSGQSAETGRCRYESGSAQLKGLNQSAPGRGRDDPEGSGLQKGSALSTLSPPWGFKPFRRLFSACLPVHICGRLRGCIIRTRKALPLGTPRIILSPFSRHKRHFSCRPVPVACRRRCTRGTPPNSLAPGSGLLYGAVCAVALHICKRLSLLVWV